MQSTPSSSSAAAFARPKRSPRREAPRVLLVDDCPVQRLLGLALLSRWNIIPQLANGGREAILLAGEQEFDIILMDLDMPVVNGLVATEAIRQQERLGRRRKRVAVVAYTANDAATSEGHWLRSGMDAVLAKPSAVAEMGECLRRWCPGSLLADRRAASA